MKILTLFIVPSLILSFVRCVIHLVAVDYYENKFTPPSLNASIGDYVEFQFHANPVNDSDSTSPGWSVVVTRGTYGGSYYDPERGEGAASSWYLDRVGDYNTWTLKINDTEPIWYYDCHGVGGGMAGVINPPDDREEGNLDEWIQRNKVVSARGWEEWEKCLNGTTGGRLGKRESLWAPPEPNATTTTMIFRDEPTEAPMSVSKESTTASTATATASNSVPGQGVAVRVGFDGPLVVAAGVVGALLGLYGLD